jgi:hypothetical protein
VDGKTIQLDPPGNHISHGIAAAAEPVVELEVTGVQIALYVTHLGLEMATMSAEHLLQCAAAKRCFDETEVNDFHIMFESHQLVFSNGARIENLDPRFLFSAYSSDRQKQENLSLFPRTIPISIRSTTGVAIL